MSIVKINNKDMLEQLQARLTLRLGKRPTQQEVLDLCVRLAFDQFDNLVKMIDDLPSLTPEKVDSILNRRASRGDIPYDLEGSWINEDDKDIYLS